MGRRLELSKGYNGMSKKQEAKKSGLHDERVAAAIQQLFLSWARDRSVNLPALFYRFLGVGVRSRERAVVRSLLMLTARAMLHRSLDALLRKIVTPRRRFMTLGASFWTSSRAVQGYGFVPEERGVTRETCGPCSFAPAAFQLRCAVLRCAAAFQLRCAVPCFAVPCSGIAMLCG